MLVRYAGLWFQATTRGQGYRVTYARAPAEMIVLESSNDDLIETIVEDEGGGNKRYFMPLDSELSIAHAKVEDALLRFLDSEDAEE